MADVSKIKLPDQSIVNIKDYRIPGVDTVPTSGSSNLITSGGVYQDIEDTSRVVSAALNDLNDRVVDIEDEWVTTEEFSQIEQAVRDTYTKQEIDVMIADLESGGVDNVVTQVNVGATPYTPSNGIVSLPAYPTTLPASDISAWAKASTKPTYTASEVGALPSSTTIPTATTAIDDNKYIPNGTTVDTKISGLGISNSNLLSGNNVFVRTNASNPLFGLKEGSNLWYCQAASNKFYFGPTSKKALSLDQNGNGNFTGSLTANSIIKSGGTSSQFLKADGSVDTNTYALASAVPSAVTESTVAGWGFTKNTGTLTTETDPVFSASVAAGITSSDITNWNSKTSNTGTVTQVKVGSTAYNPSSGVVSLPAYPTTLPASDVSAWAKAASKPTYTASEVGALPSTTVIPSAPGTLKTNATTAQTASSGEAMSGTITLHKIAKTGTYSDLIGTPTIPTKVSDLTNDSGFTSNTGTITGITMNGASKGTSGVVNLGTVLTAHQDISGKANLSGAAFTGAVTGTSSGNASQFRNITISSSEPTSSDGSNGDIWIVI